jgi:hypothetical protein
MGIFTNLQMRKELDVFLIRQLPKRKQRNVDQIANPLAVNDD